MNIKTNCLNILTTDNLSVVKTMSSVGKRLRPTTQPDKRRVYRRRISQQEETFSPGNYPNLHELFHTHIEKSRVTGGPFPFSCPKVTQLAIKLCIVQKNKVYIPECNKNCPLRKRILKCEMVNHFHRCVKNKLNSISSDDLQKPFYVKSLDDIFNMDKESSKDSKKTIEHFIPMCCRGTTLEHFSKCLYVTLKN